MGQRPVNRIVRPIDEADVVTLTGNTHPMARAEFDQGQVSDETPMERMVLHLKPSAEQQADLDALVAAQHDPDSPLYRQWLTPDQYGTRFGASAQDVTKVTAWLSGHGFRIDEVPASNLLIVFSGTAGQVSDAFHTEIHHYRANKADHVGNAQDPQIPAALADVVSGVVSMHDFRRNPASKPRQSIRSAAPVSNPAYSSGGTNYQFPADWATIYDLNSLYSAGTKGTGTSIAIVGRSNINLSDVATFRQVSGLPANNPTVILVSTDPGLVSGDQDESTLDVEWSGGIAPGATVKFVVGKSTSTTDGVDLSAQYIVNHAVAPIVSTSYGSCEQDMGATEMAFYNSLWQQAAAQGMSAFVSSGDSGAAGCYPGYYPSASGTGVNGLCSSPYSTCVGGTEFNEGNNSSKYWGTTSGTTYGSALSYIPEVVWNESGSNGGSDLWASTGGISVVYPQPSWQQGLPGTSVANGMRTVPDIAMDAASHDAYVIVEDGNFWTIAGTSAASPSFAGVMALLVQSKGGKGQGNANPGLYSLLTATHNPFHPTPSGNNSVPGVTGFSATGAAYNLATGLGSVDGAVLVSSWGSGGGTTGVDFVLTPSATAGTVQAGKSTTFTIGATESGGAKNSVALTAKAPSGVTVSFSPASIASGASSTVTVAVGSTAAAGTQNITITGSDASGSQTATYALTVTQPPTLTLASSASSITVTQGAQGTVGFTATTGGSFSGSIGLSIAGLPAGVTASWSSNPIASNSGAATGSSTLTLAASSTATVGSATVTVTAAGDGLTATQQITLQVQQAAGVTLAVSPTSISMQSLATSTVTVTATPTGGVTPSSETIAIASGLPKGFSGTFSAPSVAVSGAITWTLTLTGSTTAVASSSTLALTAQVTAKTGTVYTATQNVPMTVTLTPPTLAVSAASSSLAVTQGTNATDVVSLAGNATYSGAVTLSVNGLPSGVTASWSTNPVTLTAESGSSTLTLAASSAAVVGSATVTVTAIGDGVTATKQVALQVQQAPGVTLAVSPTSVSMQSLSSSTVTVTATPVGGVTASSETIAIASGLPKGFTGAFSAPSMTSSGAISWTLTLTGSSSAAAGSSTLAIAAEVTAKTGTVYTVSQNLPMTVTLTPPSLTVSAASTSVSVTQGSNASDVVSLAGNAAYSGPVSLSVSGLPSGVTASWNTNPVTLTAESGATALTLFASSTATVGSATITIAATGDGVTATKQIALQVQQAPGVTLAVSPASVSMQSLATTTVTVTATPVGGVTASSESIAIASGLPKGFTGTFSAPSLAASGAISWTLTLAGSSSAAAGSSTLAIAAKVTARTGTVYTVSQNLPMTVTLTPPSLAVAVASASPSVTAGSSVTDAVSLSANAVYAGATTLSVSGLPSGVSASFSANPVTLTAGAGSSTLTIAASSAATAGSSTITVTATGDGVTATQKLTLTVVVPTPTLTVTPASTTMTVVNPVEAVAATQTSASQVVTFASGGSFKGPVSVSVSGLPPYVTASWSSNPVTMSASNTGSSTLTITAGQASQNGATVTATPGTYTIAITATGSGLTVVKNIQLQVAGILVTPQTTSITIHRNSTGTLAVTTTPVGGASGVVELGLSANAAPNGITVSASPGIIAAPGNGTSTFTFTVSSTATLRSYQLIPAAAVLASSTSTTPLLIGWSSAPVTLNIVQ